MRGPADLDSVPGVVMVEGRRVPARVYDLGEDVRATVPDPSDLEFVILARAGGGASEVADATAHWWPRVVDRAGEVEADRGRDSARSGS